MHFTGLLRLAVLCAAVVATPAAGQHALEIIPLRHRTAEQVLPALRGLIEPGATLTGHGTELIVRASAATVAELRRALEMIDRPLRQLEISVRLDDASANASRELGVSARATDRGARIGVEARADQANALERVDQRIRVLEGGRAYIFTGQSTPVFDGSVMRESTSGFEVVPRLAGSTVLVDIAQRRDTLDRQQALATTVHARLGEWFEVGAAMEQASREDRGIASQANRQSAESLRVWLKVEELRP
jgi:hypothetical protein